MRKFLIIWSGQLLSTIGGNMSNFALTIWAWKKTGTATALAFISFAFLAPNLLTGLFMGVIFDRFDLKFLIILGDVITGIVSIILLLIYIFSSLEIWHIYLLIALTSPFFQLQSFKLHSNKITDSLTAIFIYFKENNYFLTIIIIEILFWFIHDIGGSVFKPLILSRTDGDTFILGSISASAGIGGVMSGLIITFWCELKNKFKSLVMGIMGTEICKFIFNFGQSVLI